jgi:hypothetical protein
VPAQPTCLLWAPFSPFILPPHIHTPLDVFHAPNNTFPLRAIADRDCIWVPRPRRVARKAGRFPVLLHVSSNLSRNLQRFRGILSSYVIVSCFMTLRAEWEAKPLLNISPILCIPMRPVLRSPLVPWNLALQKMWAKL